MSASIDVCSPATALAATATASDPAIAANELANTLGHASTVLFNYRRGHPQADAERLLNLEMNLDRQSIALRTEAIRLLGQEAGTAMDQLQGASRQVDAFLARVKEIESVLSTIGAVIGLAGAVRVGDAQGVIKAAQDVEKTLAALAKIEKT